MTAIAVEQRKGMTDGRLAEKKGRRLSGQERSMLPGEDQTLEDTELSS